MKGYHEMPAKGNRGETEKSAASGTVTAPKPYQIMIREMAAIATLEAAEARFQGDDIDKILLSDDETEMWESDELSVINAKMLSGCSFEILSLEVKYGTGDSEDIQTIFVNPENNRQMFLLIRSTLLDKSNAKKEFRAGLPEIGEEFTWNTSARYIVAKLWWMLKHGWFDSGHSPVQVTIEGTGLTGGRSVEKLKPLKVATVIQQRNNPTQDEDNLDAKLDAEAEASEEVPF
jgi:hypothetical protein